MTLACLELTIGAWETHSPMKLLSKIILSGKFLSVMIATVDNWLFKLDTPWSGEPLPPLSAPMVQRPHNVKSSKHMNTGNGGDRLPYTVRCTSIYSF